METRQQNWTQDIDNGYLYKRQFFRHGTADRRPWTHLTKVIKDTDSEKKPTLKKKWTQDKKRNNE